MNKTTKKILLLLLIVLLGLQFYRPERNLAEIREVAAFESQTQPPAEVKTVLDNKCYDCHSNQTSYPWYAELAPVSLWIDHHVEEGKEHFDVSAWASYNDKKKDHKLEELIEEVEEGEMPLASYNLLHGDITEAERSAIIAWAKAAREQIPVAED